MTGHIRINRSIYIYRHDWETVSKAVWMKYPHQDLSHVFDVYVLDRYIDEAGNLRTERMTVMGTVSPNWFTRMLGVSCYGYTRESSMVNPHKKILEQYTENLSYRYLYNVKENCTYYASPNENKTLFHQKLNLTIGDNTFTRLLEDYCTDTFYKNASKGAAVIEELCRKLAPNPQPMYM